jgi:ATP-dependent RNA helicase
MEDFFWKVGLRPEVQKSLLLRSLIVPSLIQSLALPAIVSGDSVVVQDLSGSGKTTLLAIVLNQVVDTSRDALQAILISPTRELAQQTASLVEEIGSRYVKLKCAVCHGSSQVRGSAQVWSGTPGRVLKQLLFQKHSISQRIRVLIVDEIDELASSGLVEQVSRICQMMPSSCQFVVVSATASMIEASSLSSVLGRPLRFISPGSGETFWHSRLRQYFIEVHEEKWKLDAVLDIFTRFIVRSQCIIFANECEKADWLMRKMVIRGFPAQCIHGSMFQHKREEALRKFRSGAVKILIATDIASRGLDVPAVAMVINFDLPLKPNTYVHRVGRCGRYGRDGIAISLLSRDSREDFRKMERRLHIKIDPLPASCLLAYPL